MRRLWLVLAAVLPCLAQSSADCTFQANPNEYMQRQARARRAAFDAASKYSPRAAAADLTADPRSIPRRNFIDEALFDAMAAKGIRSAPLASDEEFYRRVSLDLTGRIPTPFDVLAFMGDGDPNKRDKLIEKMLASEEFADKWTMWFGDLLKNNSFPSNFDRQQNGRNAFHRYIRDSLMADKSLRDFAFEMVTTSGNHFDLPAAATNFPIASKTPMGPIQDTYDTMLAMTSATFLGLDEMDCLLCHNGRGHLEQVNVWGSRLTRAEAWRAAAHFSRLNMPQRNLPEGNPYWRSFDVSDRATGTYDLNTNWGNRPDRNPVGTTRNLTPEYLGTRATPANGANWRVAFAESMVKDPMFARNFANRLWKEMFNLALVEPVDSLDPARLDPSNPPPDPWTLQASHPELFLKLAEFLKDYDYNLRGFIRTIAQSSAYQLSSRYGGEFKYEYVPFFARHYPRRLMAEEVHDAIAKATGIPGTYVVQGFSTPMSWAMQLPEPAEPRTNGAVATFLNFFLRGNRDSQPRSSSLSILQEMYLMNDTFVLNRLRMASSPTLQAASRRPTPEETVEDLSLLFLSRKPTDDEQKKMLEYLGKAKDAAERNTFIEDLGWVLINKPEFLFSY